ncbi:polyprenyl synthetase family protein [Streptomyces scopuliridis]|uniref:polyprenyl synthetase family protein n=1 Tax=Streptomyces scopuliridis TaxID=452529 RepID=UPI003685C1A6
MVDALAIDLRAVRRQVDAALEDFLAEKTREAAGRGHPPEVVQTVRDFLAAGGKRIRALLCVVGWHAAGGDGDATSALRVAASLELFVAFALIHDDIMDDSARACFESPAWPATPGTHARCVVGVAQVRPVRGRSSALRSHAPDAAGPALRTDGATFETRPSRRGRPAVHRVMRARLGEDERAERLGAGGALLVGNLALMWAQELLHTARLEPGRQRLVHGLYDAMLEEVMYGQYLDVMGTCRGADDVEAALRIIRYKTATATIERPLQLGAAVAGAGEATMDVFTGLGLPLGEAFQLRDDLLDVFGSPDGACAPRLSDLREGKRTVLLALGLQRADPVQRERLRHLVGRADLGERGAAEARTILQDTGAREHTERMIASRYEQVLQVLDGAGFPQAADCALRGLAVTATQYTS